MNFTIFVDEDGTITITDLHEDFIPLVLTLKNLPEEQNLKM